MDYTGIERRKYPRAQNHCVVSYHKLEGNDKFDISSAKNVSLGGMLFTSSEPFEKGTSLALKIRLPNVLNPIMPTAKVIESRELVKGVVYDTRVQFLAMKDTDRQAINDTLDIYFKKH